MWKFLDVSGSDVDRAATNKQIMNKMISKSVFVLYLNFFRSETWCLTLSVLYILREGKNNVLGKSLRHTGVLTSP